MFREERIIGKEMSSGRKDESCYVADDGRVGVERGLRLQWLRAFREVLRPLSVHLASCWTRVWCGQKYCRGVAFLSLGMVMVLIHHL